MDSRIVTAHPSRTLDATDRVLVEAMQAGQVEALREIYRRYGQLVYSLGARILHSSEEAEDLTQEIFVTLWQKCGYKTDRGSLGTYLTLITRSRAIDRLRTRRAGYRLLQRWQAIQRGHVPGNSPLEQVVIGEQAQHVKEALNELSPLEREVLEIAYYEGLSQSQIAQRLSIPLGTVKSRSRQALKKLRFKLQDLNLGPE